MTYRELTRYKMCQVLVKYAQNTNDYLAVSVPDADFKQTHLGMY